MSIRLMTAAWAMPGMNPGQKLVLIALCDNASDEGVCFPSVTTIAEKCSMGVRTVQQHLKAFEDAGILHRHERPGRSTLYTIHPRKFSTPAETAPPQFSHPTPAKTAPITVNEPSSIEKNKTRPQKRCPQDFEVTQEMREWVEAKHPGLNVEEVTESFKDYEFAKAYTDWSATWRNWCRRAFNSMQQRPQHRQPAKTSRHTGFEAIDYRKGINDDGSF